MELGDATYVHVKELRDRGYLQEANRRFFHPLGLALEARVVTDEPGTRVSFTDAGMAAIRELAKIARERDLLPAEHLDDLERLLDAGERYEAGDGWVTGIRDVRDDPEGLIFDLSDGEYAEGAAARADAVSAEWEARRLGREAALGFMVQPV